MMTKKGKKKKLRDVRQWRQTHMGVVGPRSCTSIFVIIICFCIKLFLPRFPPQDTEY
jgi:hypothetical protein